MSSTLVRNPGPFSTAYCGIINANIIANGKKTTTISMGNAKDIDIAVNAAREAYEQRWGLRVPGSERGRILMKIADLMEENLEELAAIEALDNGAIFLI